MHSQRLHSHHEATSAREVSDQGLLTSGACLGGLWAEYVGAQFVTGNAACLLHRQHLIRRDATVAPVVHVLRLDAATNALGERCQPTSRRNCTFDWGLHRWIVNTAF